MSAAAGDRRIYDDIAVCATRFDENIPRPVGIDSCGVGSTFDDDRAILCDEFDWSIAGTGEIFETGDGASFRDAGCAAVEVSSHNAVDIDRHGTGRIDRDSSASRDFTQIDPGCCRSGNSIDVDVNGLIIHGGRSATGSADDCPCAKTERCRSTGDRFFDIDSGPISIGDAAGDGLQSHAIGGCVGDADDSEGDVGPGSSKHITTTSGDCRFAIHRPVSAGFDQDIAGRGGHITIDRLRDGVRSNDSDIASSAANQGCLSKVITCFQQDISTDRSELRIDVCVCP